MYTATGTILQSSTRPCAVFVGCIAWHTAGVANVTTFLLYLGDLLRQLAAQLALAPAAASFPPSTLPPCTRGHEWVTVVAVVIVAGVILPRLFPDHSPWEWFHVSRGNTVSLNARWTSGRNDSCICITINLESKLMGKILCTCACECQAGKWPMGQMMWNIEITRWEKERKTRRFRKKRFQFPSAL